MNPRSLAGTILAFASAAVMLSLIAGLAVLVVSQRVSGDDDFDLGEYGFGGEPLALTSRPLASSYPFGPYFQVPASGREVFVHISPEREEWIGLFLLETDTGVLEDMRRQAEANGARTRSSGGSSPGFIVSSKDIEGAVQVVKAEREVFLSVSFLRYPEP